MFFVILNLNIYSTMKKNIYTTIHDFLNENNTVSNLAQEDINEILRGYIECALLTEEDELRDQATVDTDDEEYEDFDELDDIEKIITLKGKFDSKTFTSFVSDDIDIDSKIDAYNDIKLFIESAGNDAIQEAIEVNGLFKLGMDIWFTRNGHGSGFFDSHYDNEEQLTNAGKQLKSKSLYVGDDGKLYFE